MLEERLAPPLAEALGVVRQLAQEQGYRLYLVGGPVRDLLLQRDVLDLDFVVEGDAVALARHILRAKPGRLVVHRHFLTAKIRWADVSFDLATARRESYAHPGALPVVSPADIASDLGRRDYTVNAMAIALTGKDQGELTDYYHGYHDLKQGLLRILHKDSFRDDPTRILRGIRYEQRFSFSFAEGTFLALREAAPWISRLSGSRIYNEMERTLGELEPEKAILRAGELGILPHIHPSLKVGEWLGKAYQEARLLYAPQLPPTELYWAILGYHLSPKELGELGGRLNLPRKKLGPMQDVVMLKPRLNLVEEEARPSELYNMLHRYSDIAVEAAWALNPSPALRQRLGLYIKDLRYVKTSLNGDDLLALGMKPGPKVKVMLERLLEARLDGVVGSRAEEEAWVRKELGQSQLEES